MTGLAAVAVALGIVAALAVRLAFMNRDPMRRLLVLVGAGFLAVTGALIAIIAIQQAQ